MLRIALAVALAGGSLSLAVGMPAAQAAQLPTPAPVQPRNAKTVTSDFLPTAQIDSGVVWALKVIGNTVYAGGSFSAARPAGAAPGVNTVARSNLLAFDLTTGALKAAFAPTLNGQVKSLAASPDGTRLYVGGSFNTVNGTSHYNLVALDPTSGAVISSFKAQVGGSYVNAIAATDTTVYVGGLISAGNGVARKNLMAFSASAGALLGWAPTSDLQVDGMVLTPSGSKLVIAGRFYSVNGVVQRGLAALSPDDGSLQTWAAANVVKNGWNGALACAPSDTTCNNYTGKAGIYSINSDGSAIYGTGWVYANATIGNLEGSFSAEPETGTINWLEDCHGDTYTSYSDGSNVYMTGHQHDCESVGGYPQKDPTPGNMHNSVTFTTSTEGTLWRSPRVSGTYLNWEGQPSPAMIHWFPDWLTGTATGQGQAGWVMAGSGDYLVVGGEFPGLNNQTQQGIVRFARPNVSGADDPPRLSGSGWVPNVQSLDAGTATITIPGNWDRDDTNLTYKLVRSDVSQPRATKTVTSYFWYQPTVSLMDTGLTPGNTYTYRVTATDPDGNTVSSSSVSVTATANTVPAYVNRVLSDGAILYWRMGDSNGGASDLLGVNNGVKGSGVTNSSTGAIGSGTGYTFTGNSNGKIGGTIKAGTPDGWSAGIWFKTTTTRGGKLIGYGSSQTGTSSNYDRHLYMSNDGKLNFGIFQDNVARVITSPASYRDGTWHQAVVTSDASGAALYVDGAKVASNTAIIKGQYYQGYWRVGGDNLSGWPTRPTSDYFSGDLDEFAVYPNALTPAQVSTQYLVGTGAAAPTANFTSQVTNLHLAVDGSSSTAPSGSTVSSWTWDFGDGTPAATGVTATHDYAAAGSYPVTLTITDSRGLSAQTVKQVNVSAPHANPTADFTVTPTGLTAAVDASASTATDGATLTYDWDWGDGTPHGSGKTASHTYASGGDKAVVLTLTDSLGGSSSLTKTVTVSHADPVAAFTPTISGLDVSVDAGASSASDGATLTYAWSWGDSSSDSSGVTASHTYAASGSYDVTLTVTDSLGGTKSLTKSVTVVDPASLEVATSTFGTDVASGWGSASTGGAWSTTGSGFSVSGGEGRLNLAAKDTRTATLPSASAGDVEGLVDVGLNKVPAGAQVHMNYEVRKGTDGAYRLKVRFVNPATAGDPGSIILNICKLVGTTETSLVTKTISGLTFAADDRIRVDFQVTGSGTTTLRAKAWKVGGTEPSSWAATATDGESTLQDAGYVGVVGYAAAITNGPVVMSVDNLKVTRVP